MSDAPVGQKIDQGELDAAFLAVRAEADASSYGRFISDEECRKVAAVVVAAVESYRNGKQI